MSASENIPVCKVIVQAIEDRMRSAPNNQKLPTLYLIDSIIKNVGGPYINLFGRSIVSLFLDAYAVVDTAARASFEKVLGTWPNWNSQLFTRDVTGTIEREIQSIRQQRQQQYQQPSMHVNPHFTDRPHDNTFNQGQMYGSNGARPMPAQNRSNQPPTPMDPRADNVLLQDIQLLMLQKKQAIIINPNDQASVKQVEILQQLENIVKTTQLTPENSNMIRQQLAQLWTPAPTPPVVSGYPQPNMPQGMTMVSSPMPPNMMLPQHTQPQPITASSFPGIPPAMFQSHLPPPGTVPASQAMMGPIATSIPIMHGNLPMSGPGAMPMPMPMPMPHMASPVPPPAVPAVSAPNPATSDLFASLLQSGLLGPNGSLTSQLLQTTANAGRASQSPLLAPAAATTGSPAPTNVANDRVGQGEQDQSVMSIGLIELTGQDIQRRRPTAIQIMYGTPPLQCNQCGYRCPRSADAQKKMDAHLDWHFRQNRRMKDKAKKSHSRSWLVGEEDWIHSREIDLTQSQQSVFFDFGSGVGKGNKDEQALIEEIAALKEQTVSEPILVNSLRGDDPESTITNAMAMNIISKGCSICKEKFTKIWNDSEEEWSYKNATVVDQQIYHATCHVDLVRSIQRQAAMAEAAAAAAAAATSSPKPNNDSAVGIDIDQKITGLTMDESKADIKSSINLQQQIDHEMTGPDSNISNGLKRKIEADEQEHEQLNTKRTLLANDS
ncbi:hypothetical protein BGZ76_009821 [Entomortierella beljakovae]|nr:hypothetical protein BGZ76_009821 [Entomortierella beljakovae]